MRTLPLAVYLHIPFCKSKCTYCAFNTYIKLEHLIEPFVNALIREIEIVAQNKPGSPVSTIFFGGGTPSLLTSEQIGQILQSIQRHFVVNNPVEITMEANPNDMTRDYLLALRDTGINRLSLGVQSTNDNELRLFARRHDNDQVAGVVSAARAAGFDNLNVDLIYGIPHQTLDSWRWTLQQTVALKPEHLSLYALGLEDGTPMNDWVNQGRLPAPDDDLTADMYELATDTLADSGFEQYEISNWAKPGYACQHNLQYWRNLPYIGLGPGAHGYAAGKRYWTIRSPQRYIKSLDESDNDQDFPYTPATDEAIKISRKDEIGETLMMGLRLTQEGIERSTFFERFGQDVLDVHGPTIEKFAGYGLLDIDSNRIRLTRKGRLLSNAIFREII